MQERTEKPTALKLKKARERGEIAYSSELTSSLMFLSALLLLWVAAPYFRESFAASFCLGVDVEEGLYAAFFPFLFPLGMIVAGVCGVALLSHFFQMGWVWKRKRGRRGGRRFLFPLLKLGAAFAIAYWTYREPAASLFFLSAEQKVFYLFKVVFALLLKIAVAFVILGFGDWGYQKWKVLRSMQMTRQEIKEERRETEGNNTIKTHIRNKAIIDK